MCSPVCDVPNWGLSRNSSANTNSRGLLCRYPLALQQDPDSHHLGMTVWDASIVLAKYLEKARATCIAMLVALRVSKRASQHVQSSHQGRPKCACKISEPSQGALRKGATSKAALTGATVLELGSGAGLAGMAAALLGAHVALTDVADVLPLLRSNVSANFRTAEWAEHVALREQFGSLCVRELDWTKPEQLSGYDVVDCIIATDCVYHEALAMDLLRVMLHCTGGKTQGACSGGSERLRARWRVDL